MTAILHRRQVVEMLLKDRKGLLVVAGLGSTAWDITAVGDAPLNFPLWGAMGNAAMIGLGLALAQPARRVLVITGDGEMLMGLGSLATIGVQRPPNLSVVVIDRNAGDAYRRRRGSRQGSPGLWLRVCQAGPGTRAVGRPARGDPWRARTPFRADQGVRREVAPRPAAARRRGA